jgi:hypothetical protein
MTLALETLEKTVAKADSTYVNGHIVQGDGSRRFQLMGENGSSLVLAKHLYDDHFFAEPFRKAMEEGREKQQQFEKESALLVQIVEQWIESHKDKIDTSDTKIADAVFVSPTGIFRFQFIVVPQEGQEDFLENELIELETHILNNHAFQIVRLDSVLL